MAQDPSSVRAGSSTLQVIVYWAIVAVPLGWGVYKTVQKSVPLFSGTNMAATAPATPAPAAKEAPVSPVPVVAETPTAQPTVQATAAPATMLPAAPEASPFATAQPSATVAPIVTPMPPAT